MENKKDWVLIVWIITASMWDMFLLIGTSYIVFYLGFSGFWFVLAVMLGVQKSLYETLRKRYRIGKYRIEEIAPKIKE